MAIFYLTLLKKKEEEESEVRAEALCIKKVV
jgi:hypothetical protein